MHVCKKYRKIKILVKQLISFGLPVFKTHDIVEDRIKRSTEVVEESGHMEQIFIDSTE